MRITENYFGEDDKGKDDFEDDAIHDFGLRRVKGKTEIRVLGRHFSIILHHIN